MIFLTMVRHLWETPKVIQKLDNALDVVALTTELIKIVEHL